MDFQRKIERLRAKVSFQVKILVRLLGVGLLVMGCLWIHRTLSVVTVKNTAGATQVLLTASKEPADLILEAGFTTGEHDQVQLSKYFGGSTLEIKRAFVATITADGKEHTGYYADGTVADLLMQNGIELSEHDYAVPALDTLLYEGVSALVYRVEYAEAVRQEELEEATVANYIASLPQDAAFVESTNGFKYTVRYRDKLLNGQVVESELLELLPIIEAPTPRPKDSNTIVNGVPCSRIESYDDIEFGTDGLPVNYTRVMQGAVTTAYSASRGRGASGLGLYCGTVAVNPKVIPYGTRLWITDRAQNFIYGYAIATDTGTALMEGHVDIDLFFETNAECRQFGKRQLDVYVLGPAPATGDA